MIIFGVFVFFARIVKARVQQKVECYEVEWKNLELGEACPPYFVTVEPREVNVILNCYKLINLLVVNSPK